MNVSHRVCSTSLDTEKAGEDTLEIVEVGKSVEIIGEMFVSRRNSRENSLQWAWNNFNLCLLLRHGSLGVWARPHLSASLSDHLINLLTVIRISGMTPCHELAWHVIQFVKLRQYQKNSTTATSRHPDRPGFCWEKIGKSGSLVTFLSECVDCWWSWKFLTWPNMPRVVQLPTGPAPGSGPAPPNPCPSPGHFCKLVASCLMIPPPLIPIPTFIYTQHKVSTLPIIAMQLQIIFTKTSAIYCCWWYAL